MKIWTLCLLVVAGCGSSGAASTGGDSGAVGDGAANSDDGGVCCTPSASPGCCMSFGGWAVSPSECGQECDGFQLPTQITKDLHGCDVWTGGSGPVCGQSLSPDSGADAGVCFPGAACTPGQMCSVACALLCLCDPTGQYACGELPCEGGAPLVDAGADAGSTEAGVADAGADARIVDAATD